MSNFQWEFEIWKVVNQEKMALMTYGLPWESKELSWYCLFLKLDRRQKSLKSIWKKCFYLNLFCTYDLTTKEIKLSLGSTECGFIFKTMFNLTIYIPKSRLLKFHNCNHQYRICRTTHTLSTDCGKKDFRSHLVQWCVKNSVLQKPWKQVTAKPVQWVWLLLQGAFILCADVCLFSSWVVFMRSNCNPFQSRILIFFFDFFFC